MHYKNARGAILQALLQNRNYCFVISLWMETYMQTFTGCCKCWSDGRWLGIGIDQVNRQRCGSGR